MPEATRVLIAGESWETITFQLVGFDMFGKAAYDEGVGPLRAALERAGCGVTYMPGHVARRDFPFTAEALSAFDVVMLSDIGANTLLLHPDTSNLSKRMPNRLTVLGEYVRSGGGLVMVGGYMSFQGIDGRARYAGTPVEAVLPVRLQITDDRQEAPEGVEPRVVLGDHPIAAGLPDEWPALLGYNRVAARPEAALIARVGDDPLLAAWEVGRGRAVAFTSDCGPHWAPPEFLAWPGYGRLWGQIVAWAAGRESQRHKDK